jgi:predicted TIM-barrel fold metal-dependent hydrolase
VATGVTYQRAVRVLAQHLDCEPTEWAVYERRLAADPMDYASAMMRAAGAELLLVDDGYPPADVGTSWQELGRLAHCPSRPVLRIERVAEEAPVDVLDAVRAAVTEARERGYAALKTIAAYRGGLDLDTLGTRIREVVLAALEANEASGDPLPVQVHTGFGDSDLFLPRADPGYLKPLVERFRATNFVLLHCYPFVREAGWLAHVYGNVYFDLSLTIPHVSRPAVALAEALELAPVSKLLYASDAARTPELYLLAAIWWRDALAAVLPEALPAAAAEDAARMILRENAHALYRLSGERPSEAANPGRLRRGWP